MQDKIITGIITDVKPILKKYMQYKEMYVVYTHTPLKELMSMILSMTDEELDDYVIYLSCAIGVDMETLLVFFYSLLSDIDNHLFKLTRLPMVEFIFLDWVDHSSMLFRLE